MSLIVTALATGLVFSKFARPIGRVVFSRTPSSRRWKGCPTLMIRVGNERGNSIVEATDALDALAHLAHRRRGRVLQAHRPEARRAIEAQRCRARGPCFTGSKRGARSSARPPSRSPRTRGSSSSHLAERTTPRISRCMHGSSTSMPEILWGARHADILSETPEGDLVLDLRRFHEVVPADPHRRLPLPARPFDADREDVA